jgi:hypothetical protein
MSDQWLRRLTRKIPGLGELRQTELSLGRSSLLGFLVISLPPEGGSQPQTRGATFTAINFAYRRGWKDFSAGWMKSPRATGWLPTGMVPITVLSTVLITETLLEPELAT